MFLGHRHIPASYFRNFVFGVEDSLVSTVGLLSGIAIAGMDSKSILITGVTLIFVEAFSMAVGSFTSEYSAEDYIKHAEVSMRGPFLDGVVMFFSYFFSGFIPLFSYLIWPVGIALWFSIIFSLSALFLLGVIGAKISKLNIFRHGLRMLLIGGIAILVGVAAGQIIQKF